MLPANIYLFKVNNRNGRKSCEICSNLTIKTPERRDQNSLLHDSSLHEWKKYTLICIKQDVYTFCLYFLCQFCSHPSHSLRYPSFWTQQQLIHPPVNSSTLPLISLHRASSLFRTQKQLTPSLVMSSSFPLWKNHISQELLFCNILILSCLGSLWFGTHPFYPLNPYLHLYYLWSISIAKDRRYPKYFILCLVYFYGKRPPPSKIFYCVWSISIVKNRHFIEECSPRYWWSSSNKVSVFL